MGKQINFYLDEQTQNQFIDELAANDFVALSAFAQAVSVKESSVYSVYLYKPSYGELIFTRWKTPQIDALKSPVLQFRKSTIKADQRKICRGRLWVADKVVLEGGALLQKSEALLKDYQKMVRWIKKRVPYRKIPKDGLAVPAYASQVLDELLGSGFAYSL